MPITATTFAIGGLALSGIIPFAGFWSKDEILHTALHEAPLFVYVLLAGAAVLTAIYTTRVVLLTFFGEPRDHHAYDHAHESPWVMAGPLVFLSILAMTAGFVVFHSVGQALGFPGGIGEVIYTEEPEMFHFDPVFAATAVATSLAGIGIGFAYWWGDAKRAERARMWAPEVHALLVNRYYIDDLYQAIINRVFLGLGNIVALFERRVVNESGVDGGSQLIGWFGLRLKFLQTGRIPNYALAMAVGVVVLAVMAFQSA
jgi:NADH-quinone oxidoreductase subunit L